MHEEGCAEVQVNVVADLSGLDKDVFWIFTDNRGGCHPYDADGRRAGFDRIPRAIADLADDPYSSPAGALRRRIPDRTVGASFSASLVQALTFAGSHDAKYLPGWCGPSESD